MLTVLELGLNEAFSCWDSLLELSCIYTKLRPTAIFGVEQNRQFPCSPCSLKAGSIMGNFEDNWLISSVHAQLRGKSQKMLRKWKRKCSNLARTLKKCPINRNSAQKLLPSPLRFSNVYILPKNWPRFG